MTADPPAVEPISDFGAFVDELVRRHVEACDQQPHPDELIGCIDTIGNGLDVRFKALIDARARLQAAEAKAQEQHDIVARIWVQLGSPTYEQLAGRSIYDMVDELKSRAEATP